MPEDKRARHTDGSRPGYYDVPMLKPPVWKWEIAAYFFLGGLSAGAYLLARMAARFGGRRYTDVTRLGTAAALGALLPCPPLLILELGDRRRFHYMLRVFKPSSPMNLGAWTLLAFSGVLTAESLRQSRGDGTDSGLAAALLDLAGIPLALLMAGYSGVLLSTTSTPIWARNPWLGPLFSTGALSSGASAIHLLLAAKENGDDPALTRQRDTIERIEAITHIVEAAAINGYLKGAGSLAKPLTQGRYAPHLLGGAVGAGMALPVGARAAARKFKKASPWLKVAAAALGLAGSFALRWAIVFAGHESANDPRAARESTRR